MTMPGDPATRSGVTAARARARYAPTSAANGRNSGQTLAALLRQFRGDSGLSTRRLAEGARVARSTIQRLERGQLRPRWSTLARIADALDPGRREEILRQLAGAAGERIAADVEGWSRYQGRRAGQALRAGRLPLPAAWEREIRLSAASEAMFAASLRLTDLAASATGEPARFHDLLDLHDALQAEYDLLGKAAGSIWEVPPPRRHRGDPPDVSPCPPTLDDLGAVWQWLREWQVREGRRPPRSARERAIAETGARERRHVAENPAPSAVKAEDIALREA
jgi:transcriptional regulator with XRE-family HTH domain